MVNEEKQIYHCFGCAKGGDVFSFVQEIESMEFREVLKILADKAGVQLEEYKGGPSGDSKKRILEALEMANKFYETQLWKGPGKEKIMQYLYDRGINDQSIQKFRLGYAPAGWDNIINFLLGRGFNLDEISKTGLVVEKANEAKSYKLEANYYDRFRDRIMFPVMDIMGQVVGYSARVAPGQDESQAKYINTPEGLVYHKSKALYGISLAKNEIKQKNYVLLVEGNLDVIASSQAGLGNVVAVSGTALTPDQVTMLKRYSDNMAMLFDMDSAGQLAAQKSADLCLQKGINVKIVTLTDGKDAADVAQKNPELLLEAVRKSVPAMEYFFQQALQKHDRKSAEGKNNIAKEVLKHVAFLESKIEKAHWIKKIAHEVDVEEKVVSDVLKSMDQIAPRSGQDNVIKTEKMQTVQTRLEVLRDTMLGAIMKNSKIWGEICEKWSTSEWAKADPWIMLVLQKGMAAGFSFDQMLANIGNDATIEQLRKIYFNTEFGFGDNPSDNTEKDVRLMVEEYIGNYLKELQKEKVHSIIKEIEMAERVGDKELMKKLMGQLTELSQAIK